jgi:sugar transferase (PEP-CTERM/EpsH1 system associated)
MNVLFLSHRLPYAPNRGDRSRAYHLLHAMSKFARVSLFSLIHDDDEAAQIARVPFAHDVSGVRVTRLRNLARGVASLASDRPLTHCLLDAPDAHAVLQDMVARTPPDIVVAYCSSMARFALEPPLARLPLVLDMVDVDSVKWRQLAPVTHGPLRWIYRREAATLSAFEARAAREAFVTLVVNERERAVLAQIAPDVRVSVLQNGIDLEAFKAEGQPTPNPAVIFCGVMNYYPNEEGVRWFGEQVWPRVRAVRADARFTVVGSSPTRAVRRLAARDSSIEVVGGVPRVQPYLAQSAVSVAPLRLARGVQTKVIEALASGLPVVVTPAVLDGLPPEAALGCVLAQDPDDFARGVIDLLALSPERRRQEASKASLEGLTWSAQTVPLEAILTEAAARHVPVV